MDESRKQTEGPMIGALSKFDCPYLKMSPEIKMSADTFYVWNAKYDGRTNLRD